MSFIGGGATNYQEWLDFLGLVKDRRAMPVGSPFQQNFRRAGSRVEGVGFGWGGVGTGSGGEGGDDGGEGGGEEGGWRGWKRGGEGGGVGGEGVGEGEGGDDGRPAGFDGAMGGSMASCGDNALMCSCADCPDAPLCPVVGPGVLGKVLCVHVCVFVCVCNEAGLER
jgi:hypothetical protein